MTIVLTLTQSSKQYLKTINYRLLNQYKFRDKITEHE